MNVLASSIWSDVQYIKPLAYSCFLQFIHSIAMDRPPYTLLSSLPDSPRLLHIPEKCPIWDPNHELESDYHPSSDSDGSDDSDESMDDVSSIDLSELSINHDTDTIEQQPLSNTTRRFKTSEPRLLSDTLKELETLKSTRQPLPRYLYRAVGILSRGTNLSDGIIASRFEGTAPSQIKTLKDLSQHHSDDYYDNKMLKDDFDNHILNLPIPSPWISTTSSFEIGMRLLFETYNNWPSIRDEFMLFIVDPSECGEIYEHYVLRRGISGVDYKAQLFNYEREVLVWGSIPEQAIVGSLTLDQLLDNGITRFRTHWNVTMKPPVMLPVTNTPAQPTRGIYLPGIQADWEHVKSAIRISNASKLADRTFLFEVLLLNGPQEKLSISSLDMDKLHEIHNHLDALSAYLATKEGQMSVVEDCTANMHLSNADHGPMTRSRSRLLDIQGEANQACIEALRAQVAEKFDANVARFEREIEALIE